MKKIIALVLTVMMIASILVTGISAARVAYVTTNTVEPIDTREKFINATGGSPHMMDDPIATDDFTFRLVIKTPSNYYDEAKLGEFVRWAYEGPQFNMVNGTIGYNGNTLNYAFDYDTLYTIDWVVDGDTTIFVNGEEVGTLSGAMKAQMYGAFYRTMVKELSFIKDGEIIDGVKADDFDDGDTVAYLGDAEVVTLGEFIPGSTTNEYYNKNVYDVHTDAQYDGKAYYYADEDHWPDGEAHSEVLYFYPDHTKGFFSGDYVGNCVLSVDLCALSEDASMSKWADDYGFITFDMASSKIGVGGVNIALNTPWAVGEWHHVEVYSIYGDVGSVMYVDGQLLTANGAVVAGKAAVAGRFVCGGFHNVGIDNLEYYAGAGANGAKGELLYSEDFDDGVFQKANDSLGLVLDKKVADASDVHGEYDLGMYYYTWDADTIATQEKFINATGGSPHMMDDPIATDDFTFRLVIKTPSNYYDEAKLGEFVRWAYEGPQFNMVNGTIG
ncbi:MAG: hypothetical protein IJQ80_00795, partial [Clostridia bacterium]|nr:hypothetical protein [Clostridia bacterium]